MIAILIITTVTVVHCLEPLLQTNVNEEIKSIMSKYISKIPDINSRYVINDDISKLINHYFKGKISTLPIYKISLTIDRNPVKIPWTLDAVNEDRENVIQRGLDEQLDANVKQKQYKVLFPSTKIKKTKKTIVKKAKPTAAKTTGTTHATPLTMETTLVTTGPK